MTTVVDTSALLALLYPDDEHNDRAATLLAKAASDGRLAANPVVYAELAADSTFSDRADLDYFLEDTGIAVDAVPESAWFRAGDAFGRYLDRRGDDLECSACGHATTHDCPECGRTITARQHIAADFLIGAHAEAVGSLLTFDDGFYRDYFDTPIRTVAD
ncbi:MAG: PIN domain-containing protein [Halorientalis sp.]